MIKTKKNKRRLNLIDYTKRKDEALRDQKIKSLIDFDEEYCSSIRSLAVKKSIKANLTTRYLNGKMLMFSKISLKSFVYDLIDVLCFQIKTQKGYMSNISPEMLSLSKSHGYRQYICIFCNYL